MFQLYSKTRIAPSLESDLRKSFSGLESIIINEHKMTLTNGTIDLFTNKTKTRLKIHHSDGPEVWCATKCLEQGSFS